MQSLLVKIRVNEPHKQRMIRIYWRLAFAAISLPFALQNTPLPNFDSSSNIVAALERLPGLLLVGEPPTFHTKLSYVILTGFYLNTVCDTCIEYGVKSWEFVLHETFTIFFICTFPLR